MTDLNTQPKIAVTPETFEVRPSSSPDTSINVTNVSFVPILYRALSTAPRQFQVRPRQGVIESGKTETIAITYSTKADAAAASDSGAAERKEEFKIEYCRMTAEHEAAITNANGNPSIVTDLIKACSRGERKSKVVTCVIINTSNAKSVGLTPVPAVTTNPPPPPPAAAVSETQQQPQQQNQPKEHAVENNTNKNAEKTGHQGDEVVSKASERNATTDVLVSGGATTNDPATVAATTRVEDKEEGGIRSRASAGAPSLPPQSARTSAALPSATATPLPPPAAPLPEKKAPTVVTFGEDPVGFLKQNPLAAVGLFIGLYLIAKLLF